MAKTALDLFVDELLTKHTPHNSASERSGTSPSQRESKFTNKNVRTLSSLPQNSSCHDGDLYSRTVEAASADVSLVDPVWLLDFHPEVWERIKGLDEELTRLEMEETLYRRTLVQLETCLRETRVLYEKECEHRTKQKMQ